MLVRLNAWRGEDGPGEVIELLEADAAALLHHGAAHPVELLETVPPATGRVVKGGAMLEAATGTGDGKP